MRHNRCNELIFGRNYEAVLCCRLDRVGVLDLGNLSLSVFYISVEHILVSYVNFTYLYCSYIMLYLPSTNYVGSSPHSWRDPCSCSG
jgi:hypothetical protein